LESRIRTQPVQSAIGFQIGQATRCNGAGKKIPPFGRGIFKAWRVYRPMTLFLPKINEGCQGQPRTKRLPSLTQGWKSSNYSPLPVEGGMFFLTFPFIDQAISLEFRSLSIHAGV
jgi:hypothetical protein